MRFHIGSTTRRARRVRARAQGTGERARLSVFRSHRHIYTQLINDATGETIVNASDYDMSGARSAKGAPSLRERAHWVGKAIAERAKAKGYTKAAFDRGRYRYHGIVAAVAEGAREGGLVV